ncbi:MAG: MFS transporter [Clostridia bacterium]|nr:MFS transporter [Clostridia bacterium]
MFGRKDSAKNPGGLKLDVKKTILTGFGFMGTSIAWTIYDPYITKILNKLLNDSAVVTSWSSALVEKMPVLTRRMEAQGEDVVLAGGGFTLVPLFIGIIMTFDNIFGVIFQPLFGKLSDRCRSRLGKRRPFILFGAPVSALLFFLIPMIYLNTSSLPLTMTAIILFVFIMSLWRSPVVALMPDLTPPELQSEANAVINLMGGVGSAVGMIAGTVAAVLCKLLSGATDSQIAADETITFPYVFAIGSVVMIAGMLIVMFFVHEKPTNIILEGDKNRYADEKARHEAEKAAKKARNEELKKEKLSKAERRSLGFMLACLFFLFCASNAITTFFSLFAAEILHLPTRKATTVMLVFAVVYMISAIPAGKMGRRIGRKKTIMIGLAVFLAAFFLFFGIFMGLMAGKGLTLGKYVAVNNQYNAVSDQITAYNSEISDKAKAEGRALTDGSLITYEGLTDYYLGEQAPDGMYADFAAWLAADGFDIEKSTVSVAKSALVYDAQGLGPALAAIGDAVGGVTAILGKLIYPVLVFGGAASMFITVNTLPLVLEIGGPEKVGTFTGYYYTATFSAQIASPILYGFIRMFAGTYLSLFYYSPVMFALAIIMILFVRHGEPVSEELIKQAEAMGD